MFLFDDLMVSLIIQEFGQYYLVNNIGIFFVYFDIFMVSIIEWLVFIGLEVIYIFCFGVFMEIVFDVELDFDFVFFL